ncbi:MAG: outer membrane lipoprotein carrier protein LolA [Myxococcota bacterium]|nr:outer membrane lipoprotein carrier protein LolA [Myxococcota bacterium]
MHIAIWILGIHSSFANSVSDIVKQVEDKYRSVQSIQADFEQKTKSSFSPAEITVKGQVVLKRKRKMRWQFDAPDSRVFWSDGAKAYMWNPSQKQYFVLDDMSSGATQILDNLASIDQYFEVAVPNAASGDDVQLQLKPKAGSQLAASVKSLEVELKKSELMLSSVVVHDHMGSVTSINFENVELNPNIDDTIFTFEPPEGAEIIKTNGP